MARLSHLGPDRSAAWLAGPIGLGHLMMRIVHEDSYDAQPLHDAGLSLVADLRLDNREELAAALSIGAEALTAMPDSALLLAAFKKWGADCVDRVIGDFAFAVWDEQRRTLTLARDHMGQRHVFYHLADDFFAFATEIKGLWALPQVPRKLIEERVAQSLLFDEPDDHGATNYEGIRGLPGGTVLTIDADGLVSTRRYWEPHADPAHEGHNEAYYIETYLKVLTEAVECRLRRAAAGTGLMMGGGFDSSAICALAGPVVTAQGRKLIAVSSVLPEDYRGTIHHARRWCEICRRHMPHVDMRYVTHEALDIFSGMERAFLANDNAHSPNRPLSEAMFTAIAAAGARVLMDGHGGDYTLNPRGRNALVRMLWKGQFGAFLAEVSAMRRHLNQSVKQTLVRNVLLLVFPPASWRRVWRRWRNGVALFGPPAPVSQQVLEARSKIGRPRVRQRSVDCPRVTMERVLRWQQRFPAQGYSIVGARYGLKFTQPFHDKRVVELGLAIPEELYVKNGKTRYLARAALKDLYPPEYQDRPPGNDPFGPDFLAMARRAEPRVLAEIERMENAGRLSRYFDFPRMRAMLTRRRIWEHASGNEAAARHAMSAFVAARYVEWFRGDNA